jgi:hypothetical protein
MLNQTSESGGQAGGAGRPAITREAWLHVAAEVFRPRFTQIGLPLPERLHISVGFGYGSRAESRQLLAQCWARCMSADGVNHIFISPAQGDPAAMLAALLHELIHAADDCASGHKGAFAAAAVRLGLEGKMTATTASLDLAAELITLAEALGDFPHAKLDPEPARVPVPVPPGSPAPVPGKTHSGPAKQGTRMLKLTAGGCCGYTVRTTRKWLDDQGEPLCPHGTPMTSG